MLNQVMIFFGIGLLGGCLMCLCSVWLGAWMSLRAAKGNGVSIRDPKGEVFTVEDVDDIPFPETGKNASEEHVQKKNNSFLKMFGSSED